MPSPPDSAGVAGCRDQAHDGCRLCCMAETGPSGYADGGRICTLRPHSRLPGLVGARSAGSSRGELLHRFAYSPEFLTRHRARTDI